jgi:hypothetical protein
MEKHHIRLIIKRLWCFLHLNKWSFWRGNGEMVNNLIFVVSKLKASGEAIIY